MKAIDINGEPESLAVMKAAKTLWIFTALVLAGCGVDSRWGSRSPTNESHPGSPGVDARWGAPRSGLRDPLKWQYENLPQGDEASGR